MSELKRDNDAAVKFLRSWSLNGPWALTAINTNRRGLTGEVFLPTEEVKLRAWLDQGTRQLFTFRVADRFADAGLTGILSLTHEGDSGP